MCARSSGVMEASYRRLPGPGAAPQICAALPIIVIASEDSSLGPTVSLAHPVKEQCKHARIATYTLAFLGKSSRLLMCRLVTAVIVPTERSGPRVPYRSML